MENEIATEAEIVTSFIDTKNSMFGGVTHLVVLLSSGTTAIEEFSVNRVAFPVLRSEATRTRNREIAPLMRVLIAALLLFIQYAVQVVHRRFVAGGSHCVAHLAGRLFLAGMWMSLGRSRDTCEWLCGARFIDTDIVAVAATTTRFGFSSFRLFPSNPEQCLCT